MRALIVVESYFGNTRQVAAAIAEGVSAHVEAEVVDVLEAPATVPDGLGLLVVGGPTHAHGMSNPDSRRSATQRGESTVHTSRTGIREWLAALAAPPPGVAAAAFDTRIKGPRLVWGSASQGATKELERLSFAPVVEPASFLVRGPLGPVVDVLVEGEIERARAWGERLGADLAGRGSPAG